MFNRRTKGNTSSCHQFSVLCFNYSLGLVRHQIIDEVVIHLFDEFKIAIFRYVIFCNVLFEHQRELAKLKSKEFFLAFVEMA